MNLQTAQLLQALGAVTKHTPQVVRELAAGQLSPARQREYGGLLTELGELLQAHADDQDRGVIMPPTGPAAAGPADLPEP